MSNDTTSTRPALTTLSDDEAAFRDAVAAFAEGEVRPRVQAMEREEGAARDLVRSLLERGRGEVLFQVETLTDHVTQNLPRVEIVEQVGQIDIEHVSQNSGRVCRDMVAGFIRWVTFDRKIENFTE